MTDRPRLEKWPKPGPRTRRLRWRRVSRLRAFLGGFFWLPCPACGQMFGGHESSSLAVDGRVVCPAHDPVWPWDDGAPPVAPWCAPMAVHYDLDDPVDRRLYEGNWTPPEQGEARAQDPDPLRP